MKTATRALIIASVLGASCSGDPETRTSNPPTGTNPVTNPTVGPIGGTSTPTSGVVPSPTPTGSGSMIQEPPLPVGECMKGVPNTTQVPRITPIQYDNTMRDLLGVTAGTDGKALSTQLGGENRGAMTNIEWNSYQNVAAATAKAVLAGANKAKYISCDAATAGCLESTVKAFGLKAFRRPLTDEEVKAFMAFDSLTPKGKPAEVAEAILYSFLVSPSFILMPELATDKDADGNYKLTPYETATRLATLIWRSTPDDALLTAASKGELTTKEQIFAQAQRMIGVKEKSGSLLSDFHRFYAEIRENDGHWDRTDHDPKLFPKWVSKDVMSKAMMAETNAFFQDVGFNGKFSDLFLSPVAFVNKDTAPIYGLDASKYGADMVRVELDPAQRPGFLTRVGFLSSFSRNDSTSPILRGAFIGQKMLGAPPVAPKQGVPKDPPAGDYKTQREKIDTLTEPAECKGCHHVAINPPGYVMEMFNSIGEVQTKDALGGDINMVADVQVDGVVKTIKNPRELMEAIATGTAGRRMYAQRWVEYATGRSANAYDTCAVDAINMKLSSDGSYTIVKLLGDLSQTDTFNLRTTGN